MAVTIKLDSSAMQSLFPEGSEARVELARAVVVETVRQLELKMIQSVTAVVLEEMTPIVNQVRDIARKECNKIYKDTFSNMLNANAQRDITMFVENKFHTDMYKLAEEIVTRLQINKSSLEERVTKRFAQSEQEIEKYVHRKTNELLREKIDSIIEQVSNNLLKESN